MASYADTGERYLEGGRCEIDGVPCLAEEARFGGIVIQVRELPSSRHGETRRPH